ncbi:MAG: hypothetical protein CMH52_13605 [Myxococcales bacterium]|nr:hypothetical protein [Myxococcales bacterium]
MLKIALGTALLMALPMGANASGAACKLVQKWAKTQRDNNFRAYGALYAKKGFEGIKRTKSGREKKYNRARWLKDRKKMFKPGTAVYIKDCKIESKLDGKLNVIFTQLWRSASGKYADQGTKRLVLAKQRGRARIVQEIMLTSTKWDGVITDSKKTSRYSVRVKIHSYMKDDEDVGETPRTKYILTHGPAGEVRHTTHLFESSGGPMEIPGPCPTSKLPFECSTFWAGEGGTVTAKRKGKQIIFKTCYSEDGAGGYTDCQHRYSIALPRGAKVDFKAK